MSLLIEGHFKVGKKKCKNMINSGGRQSNVSTHNSQNNSKKKKVILITICVNNMFTIIFLKKKRISKSLAVNSLLE